MLLILLEQEFGKGMFLKRGNDTRLQMRITENDIVILVTMSSKLFTFKGMNVMLA